MMLAELPLIQPNRKTRMSNGGWAYDSYPELEKLDAGATITIAEIEGPAVIHCIHTTQHFVMTTGGLSEEERKALGARGILLTIYFDGQPDPAVRVPLGDFFADGCCGKADHFTTPFVEKVPESYNCYFPMPFRRSARIQLTNETSYDLHNYSFVEYELLDEWEERLGYFHATWDRFDFQLNPDTNRSFLELEGSGHLVGRSMSLSTAQPFFKDFFFIMEANNEFYIDGSKRPVVDYLGTEDSYGFSWGFRKTFAGLFCGINHLRTEFPIELSIYRFLTGNCIRFEKELKLRLNWQNEFRHWPDFAEFAAQLNEINRQDTAHVDYAMTYYWYQDHIGYPHAPLLPLAERICPLLHSKTQRAEG